MSYSRLTEFLKDVETTEPDVYTHVSMGETRRKYLIPRQQQETFWELYCKVITDYENTHKVCIAERPQELIALYFDFDIKKKFKNTTAKLLYKKKSIISLIGLIQNKLQQYIGGLKEWELTCVLLEKTPYITRDGMCSSGFHLHFPYIALNRSDIQTYIYQEIQSACKQLCDADEIFPDLEFNTDIKLDTNVTNVCWLMYGSCKNESSEPYIATKAYDSKQKKIDIWETFKKYALFNIFDDKIVLTEDNYTHYLPRLFSIIPKILYARTVKKPAMDMTKDIFEKAEKYSKRFVETKEITAGDVGDIKVLLGMLSIHRAINYSDWVQIGSLLYNLGLQLDSEEMMFNMNILFHEFSQRASDKYDERSCEEKWKSYRKNNYSMGSLHFFASIDSPTEYEAFKNVKTNQTLERLAESGAQSDIAIILHKMFNQEFTCAHLSQKSWYHFTGHVWVEDQEGRTLRTYMSTRVVKKYEEFTAKLYKDLTTTEDKDMKDKINKKLERISKIIFNLKTNGFKKGVLNECADIFYDENFYDQLDKNPHLIAFRNGVYDLTTSTLRDGRPDDYLSKVIPHNYVEFSHTDKKVIELKEIIKKIFPDEELRIYFMNSTCEFYEGFNKRKQILVWTGNGNNGKSVIMKFLEASMGRGRFVIKMPTTLLTGKKPPSGVALPELYRSSGARLCIFDEPSKNEMINGGMAKLMSGGDSFYVRTLFKEGGEVEPFFKMVIICNDKPKIDSEDQALFNRLRVLPFEALFTDKYPATVEEQFAQKHFPMDKDLLETRYRDYCEEFNWLMLDNYKRIRENPHQVVDPAKVRMETEKYRKDNDVYSQFLSENYCQDPNSVVNIKHIFEAFKDWYKAGYPKNNSLLCSRNELADYITKKWGKPINNRGPCNWRGYRACGENERDDDRDDSTDIKKDKVEPTEDTDDGDEDIELRGDAECEDSPESTGDVKCEESPKSTDSEEGDVKPRRRLTQQHK